MVFGGACQRAHFPYENICEASARLTSDLLACDGDILASSSSVYCTGPDKSSRVYFDDVALPK
jgi:hypothetical protein